MGVGVTLRSGRDEKIDADIAAPVAADTPAMMARVVFDILARSDKDVDNSEKNRGETPSS